MLHPLITLLVLLLCSNPLFSQRLIERNFILNPLNDTTKAFNGNKVSLAHSLSGWAGFGKYTGVKNNDHEWYQQLGIIAELVRFRNNSTLAVTTQFQMIADPNNNINLNPRAIFWEEGLFYMWKPKDLFYKVGYYHRCKHDIDNLDLGEERGLIYASLFFETILQKKVNNNPLILAFKNDIYTVRQDYRNPYEESPFPSVEKLLTSFKGNFHYQKLLKNQVLGFFVNGYTMLNVYSHHQGVFDRLSSIKGANINAGLSAGMVVNGNANIRLGFNYEYLSDTGISATNYRAHLLSFGITGLNPLSVR